MWNKGATHFAEAHGECRRMENWVRGICTEDFGNAFFAVRGPHFSNMRAGPTVGQAK